MVAQTFLFWQPDGITSDFIINRFLFFSHATDWFHGRFQHITRTAPKTETELFPQLFFFGT